MPKIRGIKPDIWTDEDFVELSPFARLLWIGMWNYACDNGHLRDRSKQIKMRVLPTDEINCAELLRELETNGRIARINGWITVPNFTKQQRPDKRFFITCDAPGCRKPGDPERETRSGHVEATSAHHEPTSSPLGDVDGEGDGELMVIENPRSSERDGFAQFWDTYSHKVGRKKAETAYRAALKKPGVTHGLLAASAAAYITYQIAEGKHPAYTKHAATWLTGEHWRDERPARQPPQGRVSQHMALVRQLTENQHVSSVEIGPTP